MKSLAGSLGDKIGQDREVNWEAVRVLCEKLFDPSHPGSTTQRVLMVRSIEDMTRIDVKNTATLREIMKMAVKRTGGAALKQSDAVSDES